jgi:hypothetical protein
LFDENRYFENDINEDLEEYEESDIDGFFIIFKVDFADNDNDNENYNLIIIFFSEVFLNNNTVRELRKKY